MHDSVGEDPFHEEPSKAPVAGRLLQSVTDFLFNIDSKLSFVLRRATFTHCGESRGADARKLPIRFAVTTEMSSYVSAS